MFADPEPLDEDDPQTKEELFRLYETLGWMPSDLKTASAEEKAEYKSWLELRLTNEGVSESLE